MKRFKSVKIASIVGIIANLFLFIIKILIGLISNSQAMIADTFNSAGDIFSSVITFIGNKIASKHPDDDHNLGHGKAEYVYSMLMSIVMIFVTLFILRSSFVAILNNEELLFSKWLFIVCIITIIIKFSLYIYTKKLAKTYDNLLIRANSYDHRNDCLLASFTLVSSILSYKGINFVDGIVGIIISLWIIISYLKIFIESYDVLMDKSISLETKNKVYEIIDKHKEIKKTQHFISTPVGYKYQISLTIFVDGNLSTLESHKIADDLEKEINKNIDEIYLTVIHVNPFIEK